MTDHLALHSVSADKKASRDWLRFFQFEIIINVLVSSLRLIWIPMLCVYGYYKYFNFYSAKIDFRRQHSRLYFLYFFIPTRHVVRLRHTNITFCGELQPVCVQNQLRELYDLNCIIFRGVCDCYRKRVAQTNLWVHAIMLQICLKVISKSS